MDTLVGVGALTTYASSTAAAFVLPAGNPLDVYFHEPTMLMAAILGGRYIETCEVRGSLYYS
jgi:cation transport ATPase